jgi:hypothetical protein
MNTMGTPALRDRKTQPAPPTSLGSPGFGVAFLSSFGGLGRGGHGPGGPGLPSRWCPSLTLSPRFAGGEREKVPVTADPRPLGGRG